MPSTTYTKWLAAAGLIALAACAGPPEAAAPASVLGAGAPSAAANFAAREVEAGLRAEIGPAGGGALTEVRRDGGTVTAVLELPIAAEGLTAAQQDAAAGAIRETFVGGVCGRAGLAPFFAAGGVLRIEARGSDGAPLADLPVTSCGA